MNKKSGHVLIYVVALMGFISLCFIGALKAQVSFSAMSQANIKGTQSDLLAENALFLAENKMLEWEGPFPEKVELFESSLGPQGKIKAVASILPSKYNFIELEGIGKAGEDSKGSKKAIYAYGKTSLKREKTEGELNRLEKGNLLFQDNIPIPEQKRSVNYLFFERPQSVRIGQTDKLILKEGNMSISRLPEIDFKCPDPLKIDLDSPLEVNGDMQILGDLYLHESLYVKGNLLLKGKLFLDEGASLSVSGQVMIEESLKEDFFEKFLLLEEQTEHESKSMKKKLDKRELLLEKNKVQFLSWPKVKERYFFIYREKNKKGAII